MSVELPTSRRSSRASTRIENTAFQSLPASTAPLAFSSISVSSDPDDFVVGGPPNSPSPLALRIINSPSSKHRVSRAARVPVDVHLLEYVDNPDSNLICLICHCPFDRPVQLACSHYYCAECLDAAISAIPEESPKTCPTCRRRIDLTKEPHPAPKILESLLDDLQVKCPNEKAGCTWTGQRGIVYNHVNSYCEHAQVECPDSACRFSISQKDFHKGCLHYSINCDYCHTSVMRKDIEEHHKSTCLNRMTQCEHCNTEILRVYLKDHVKDECLEVTALCPGSGIGCSYSVKRKDLSEHTKSCPMATIAPFFKEQQIKLEQSEAKVDRLQRRADFLEEGVTNISTIVFPGNSTDFSSFPMHNPLDPNHSDGFTSTSLAPETPGQPASSSSEAQVAVNNQEQHPLDASIQQLFTMHDALREEVTGIANSLNELDGRTSMLLFNERQTRQEDMMRYANALTATRAQVNYLVGEHWRLHRGPASTANASRASSSSNSAANSATTRLSSSAGNTTMAQGARMPMRRLSDTTRQETKL